VPFFDYEENFIMKIESITISNFRCFGPEPTTVLFDDLTCFVGANGTGKSAVLQALAKVFGITSADRKIEAPDFHVAQGGKLTDEEERSLYIEIKLVFPELQAGGNADGVAECFNQMVVSEPGGQPFCRVRLDAVWNNTSLAGIDVDSKVSWITTDALDIPDEHKHPMKSHERSRIQIHYIPATRDPGNKQIKQTSGTVMHRLMRAIEWSDDLKTCVQESTATIQDKFSDEKGIGMVQQKIGGAWNTFLDGNLFKHVQLTPLSSNFDDMVEQIQATFSPGVDGREETIDRLSDGQKSLFYISLIKSVCDVEGEVLANVDSGVSADQLKAPSLTLLAIEEPENHLAPHYLGRVLKSCNEVIATGRAQVVLSSHSPALMRRIEPEQVRYLRLDSSAQALVRKIVLPEQTDESFKYVKEAVKAYPELYFSKVVVLGEGDSEEIVIPHIARALDTPLDESFVSMVPLGGRHVNHFWKLLTDLKIPYVTLLDFDKHRGGGGWGRIKYALNQLIKNGVPKADLLALTGGTVLSDEQLGVMQNFSESADSDANQQAWINRLGTYGVYFSHPLDIDWMLLKAFPDAYKTLEEGLNGPTFPKADDPKKLDKDYDAVGAVLKKEGSEVVGLFESADLEDYYWYRYLFLGRGKPSSHILAMTRLDDAKLVAQCPPALTSLVEMINKQITAAD
jgi:predicted ATP-dependent endonuclease of OLD family